ncbi:transposase [Aquimarina sp. 2201CG1-2-11]|uniref:transposase n=1 Tax=Aquimarina discodermiae TaxID=3231043 RepID=UPI0034618998
MFDFIVHIRGFRYFYNVKITLNNSLTNDPFLLQEAYDTLVKEHQKLQFDYQYLQQQLSELKRMVFGSKSERFVASDTGQLDLFVEPLEISGTRT